MCLIVNVIFLNKATCQRRSAATVSRHASAQAASSTPPPDAPLPVHAPQMSIDSTSILRNMTSRSGISACATPSTAQRTAYGAACRRKAASRGRTLLVKRSAHCAAWGTALGTRSLFAERLFSGRPPSCANTLSQTRTETARTRWRSAAATGSAIVAEGDQGIDVQIVASQPDHRWNQLGQAWPPLVGGVIAAQSVRNPVIAAQSLTAKTIATARPRRLGED